MVENTSEIEDIAGKIRCYLLEHPNAADSLEGIVHWWLVRQQVEFSAVKVKMALDYLVSNDLISKSTTVGGQVVYANMKRSSTVH
jgi:hypothetical protein